MTYTVPTNPADPEAAALELIVRLPGEILHTTGARPVLQEYCSMLHAEGAFTGLSWPDAKAVAAAVCFDIVNRDDAADCLRNRARDVLAGTSDMAWQDSNRAARALAIAAAVYEL
jgi:hypothetical protein